MAVTLEDELAAEAAERERARLEEEALIAAAQAESQRNNFISQPDSEIAAIQAQFNQPPPPVAIASGMPRQMIGDTQYQQEVARAQAGSGFIAPDIGPSGNVITPGYDPTRDFVRLKAEENAMRYKGQQLYQSLVAGGATPAEAYRASGHLLNFSNPLAQVKADALMTSRQPIQPEVRDIGGVRMMRSGPNSWSRIPEPRTTRPVIPPDAKAGQTVLQGRITDTRNDLERAKKVLENDPNNPDAARRAVLYQNQLRDLEAQFQKGSTNWMGGTESPTVRTSGPEVNASPVSARQPAPAKEVIRFTKDGRAAVFNADTKQFLRYQ